MQIDKNVYEHLYVFANYFTYKFVLSSIYALSYKSSLQTETNQWKQSFSSSDPMQCYGQCFHYHRFSPQRHALLSGLIISFWPGINRDQSSSWGFDFNVMPADSEQASTKILRGA